MRKAELVVECWKVFLLTKSRIDLGNASDEAFRFNSIKDGFVSSEWLSFVAVVWSMLEPGMSATVSIKEFGSEAMA